MALTDQVIMPGADYQAAANQVRTLSGTTATLKSGEMVTALEGANNTVAAQTTQINALIQQANNLPDAGGSGTDLALGITGATVGQIAKITAVDSDGKPTAWTPVDMPSGGEAEAEEFIQEIPLTADVGSYVLADLAIYKKVRFIITKTYADEGSGSVFLTMLGAGSMSNRIYQFLVAGNSIKYQLSEHIFARSRNGRLDYSSRWTNNDIIQVTQNAAVSKYVDASLQFGSLLLTIPASYLASAPADAKIEVYGVRA